MLKLFLYGLATLIILCFLFYLSVYFASFFHLGIPPALLGIASFLFLLATCRGVPGFMDRMVALLLKHIGLFLIPAIVSVLAYLSVFQQWALLLFLVVVLSTVVCFALVATIAERLFTSQSDNEKRDA